MTVTNPPGWLQNAGNTHTAAQLRTYLAALQAGNYSTATTLRARGGVHPSLGQELVVTQTGSPSMAVLVESGVASIPGNLNSTQGNYIVCNDAQVTLSIAAAHATLPRIDIVVINVRDSQYSGASNDCQLQVITGTPNSSPVAPTAPDNSITLAQVAVAAADTSITNGEITDTRFYLAAVGGVINARTEATRPSSAEIAEGQLVWTMDGNKLWVWDGSAYKQLYPTTDIIIRKTADETLSNSTTLQNDDQLTTPVSAGVTYEFECVVVYGAGSTADLKAAFTYPTATMEYIASGLDSSTGNPNQTVSFSEASGSAKVYGGAGIVSFRYIWYKGRIAVTSSGNLTLQWAQNSPVVENTVVKAGSTLHLEIVSS